MSTLNVPSKMPPLASYPFHSSAFKPRVHYQRVKAAMRKMGVDHLDLVQLHWYVPHSASRGRHKVSLHLPPCGHAQYPHHQRDMRLTHAPHPCTSPMRLTHASHPCASPVRLTHAPHLSSHSHMSKRSFREDFNVRGYLDAARWLADLREDGLVRHVGLTNFDTKHLLEASCPAVYRPCFFSMLEMLSKHNCPTSIHQVLDAGVKVASNQVSGQCYHPPAHAG